MDTTDTSKDEHIRKEFARAFGWFKTRETMYARYDGADREPRIPTWEEIFVEVGRLLSRPQTLYDKDQFRALNERMDNLELFVTNKKDTHD